MERDGNKLLRIPLLVLGKWKHPRGLLDFTRDVIGRMRKNFLDGVVGNKISWDNRHKPELGALAWFEDFVYEEQDDKKLLVGYAKPTPAGDTVVDEERYKYASIEFHPNWESPLVAALSGDELEEYSEEEVITMTEPVDTDVTQEPSVNILSLDEQLQEEKERALKLEERANTLEAEALASQAKLVTMESQAVLLETRLAALEQVSYRQFAENVILEAESFRDDEQRAHPKPFLDWMRAIMLEAPIGEEDETISLEEADRASVSKTRAYYRKSIVWLSQNLPGSVLMAVAGTAPDTFRVIGLPEEIDEEALAAEARTLWEA